MGLSFSIGVKLSDFFKLYTSKKTEKEKRKEQKKSVTCRAPFLNQSVYESCSATQRFRVICLVAMETH